MKILITTGIYPPEVGGPATYAALVEKELPKYGVEVTVLPFRVVRHLPKIIRHVSFFFKVLKIGFKMDLLYTQDPVSVGFPTMLVSKMLGKPFLIRMPGDYAWEQATGRYGVKDGINQFQHKKYGFNIELIRFIQSATARFADKIITPSKYFGQLVSLWNPSKKNVVSIYNGIDLVAINSDCRNSYEPKSIISAGRLIALKGFNFLISIMPNLPEWKLYIAGDGPERQNLQTLIENHGLAERVFLLGPLGHTELISEIKKSEIFAIQSSFESFSFQVVESMRSGTPVIATKVGALSEIIDSGKEGFLVEPNNKEQFLDALKQLGSAEFRQKIVESAFKKSELFSIENTVKQTSKLIKDLITSKNESH